MRRVGGHTFGGGDRRHDLIERAHRLSKRPLLGPASEVASSGPAEIRQMLIAACRTGLQPVKFLRHRDSESVEDEAELSRLIGRRHGVR